MLPRQLKLPVSHRLSHHRSRFSSSSSFPPPPSSRDDTDGPPPKKRPRRAAKQPPELTALSLEGNNLVRTHNEAPIKCFSLFLPSTLPASIVTDESSLMSYVLATTSTYLSLWKLDNNMELLDLRCPGDYLLNLTFRSFIPQFLKVVTNQLAEIGVKSVEKLILPSSSPSDIPLCLESLIVTNSPLSLGTLYIPLHADCTYHSLSTSDLSAISKISTKAQKTLSEVTLVSENPEHHIIVDDVKKACSGGKRTSIKFSFLNEKEAYGSPAGPGILGEPEKTETESEMVSPQTLIASLNSTGLPGKPGREIEPTPRQRATTQPKQVLRRALTTDCSYTEYPHLSADSTYTSSVWDLERLHQNGINGTGTTIAVLDSGINFMSPAFKDKILAVKNFVPSSIDDFDCAIDSDGHGSLCAGIAAGSSFYCPITQGDPQSPCLKIPPGVAPGAKLIICKVVCTSSSDVDNDAFLEALKWIKELHVTSTKIDVVSISLASSYFSQERAQVITELINLGAIVVCCASNVGRMKMHPISFPARLGHVICVGSHDANGKPTSFTPVGRELDFLAPGEDIWGPGPGTQGPFAMDCGSGTSCSTPAIAGLISLILHNIRERCETLNSSDTNIAGRPICDYIQNVWVMRELLKQMSSSPGHHSEEIGYGTLNPYRLFDSSTEEIVRIINDIVQDED